VSSGVASLRSRFVEFPEGAAAEETDLAQRESPNERGEHPFFDQVVREIDLGDLE
jgi:hypothetical protein